MNLSEDRRAIYQEIESEREYQDSKWGGPGCDDARSLGSFVSYIDEYSKGYGRAGKYDFRTRMLKTAGLAVAAIETHDRRQSA